MPLLVRTFAPSTIRPVAVASASVAVIALVPVKLTAPVPASVPVAAAWNGEVILKAAMLSGDVLLSVPPVKFTEFSVVAAAPLRVSEPPDIPNVLAVKAPVSTVAPAVTFKVPTEEVTMPVEP